MSEAHITVEITRLQSADLTEDFFAQAATLLQTLVKNGAAIGWVEPPPAEEVEDLLRGVVAASKQSNACLVAAWDRGRLLGLSYWIRYERPTHNPHVDIEKVAVDPAAQGRRIGRRIMLELLQAARDARVEVVTLDLRGDNVRAMALYESLGFTRYGLLPRFVAFGEDRYDKLFYALDLRDETA
ncbi:GNAT family N-acetyltransferase [Leucobacter viscericola]|uniref:GNAT family N-acetyltransferase n=1 Tax=Leucobacter viscericola TaxID=2714935 RepID=A0A6G7XFC1_9MICO|nr:GNAT family N-acetyltransferase [Leucobacter viscericola]QIK63310.1 GNAT family N-acetyltransferase [Leucobacter viscericola]